MSTEGAELWREGRRAEQAAKDAQLQNALESASTDADKQAAVQAIYGPSVFKQRAENLLGRLVGRKPQPVVSPYAQPPGVQGPAPRSRQEALADIAARGTTPEQRDLAAYKAQLDAQLQSSIKGQQAGTDLANRDLATRIAAVRKIQADPSLSDGQKRDLMALYGVPNYRATTDENKRLDYQALAASGQLPKDGKGNPLSYEAWVAYSAAQGRQGAAGPKPPATKNFWENGKVVIKAWNPATGAYDRLLGLAPPNYAQVAEQVAKARALYGAMYGTTQVTDASGNVVDVPRLAAVQAFEQGTPYFSADYGKPTASEKQRQDFANSAQFIIPQMKMIIANHPEVFGPVAGRTTTAQAWLGSQSPDAQRFLTGATILGEHSAAVFGSRAQKVAEQIQNVATDPKINPDALTAGLDELNSIAGEFTNPGGRLPSTAASGPRQSSAPAPRGAQQAPIVQRSKKTGAYRYSLDGGKTWQAGQPPRK